MRYLILGTGAVGGMIGGRLAAAGLDVTFYDRPPVAEHLRQNGLHVLGLSQPIHIAHPTLITHLDDFSNTPPPDAVLLSVKAYEAPSAAGAIVEQWPDPPTVISIINGVGVEESLEPILGEGRILPATLTSAVQKIDVGAVRIEKQRGVGLSAAHPLAPSLAAEWNQAGINTLLYPDAARMKWSKLLTNLISNATSAITGLPADQVYRHRDLFRLEVEALREAVRVMDAIGFKPHSLPGVPVRLLSETIFFPPFVIQPVLRKLVGSGRGAKWPSFYYDVGRGRSEVAWLNGAVVEHGRRLGIPTPANAVLTDVLTQLVEGKLPPEHFRQSPQALVDEARRHQVPGL